MREIKLTWWQNALLTLAIVGHYLSPPPADGVVHAELVTMIVVGLLLSAASLVLSELLKPKPNFENAKPAGEGDFNFPTATEGRVVPLFWGRVKVAGPNVVWWGNLVQQPIKEKIKTGLWSSTTVVKGHRYYAGIQMAIGHDGRLGDGCDLHKIWVGDKVLTSGPFTHATAVTVEDYEFLGGDQFGSGGMAGDVRFYDGRSDQAVNSYLQGYQGGATRTPAYRGTAYVVAEDIYIGNSTSVKPWAFEVSRYPTGLFDEGASADYTSGHHIVGSDANPMEVVFEYLTDSEWGLGLGTADLDLVAMAEAAEVLYDEGNGFSMTLDRAIQGSELLELVQRQIDGVFYLDKVTGKITVKLARDDYANALEVTSVTGTNTFNVAADGDKFQAGDTIYAEGMTDAANDGEWEVQSSTATTVVVVGTPLTNQGSGGEISSVKLLDNDHVLEVKDFSRQTWDGTSNQVAISFTDRARDYFETSVAADDISNQQMQQGAIVPATIQMPGVKDSTLAANLAERELQFLSYPLAKATLVVDRTYWDTNPGDVLRWTDGDEFSNLAMRVTRVDYGGMVDGKITLTLVQDIFAAATAAFTVQTTGWTQPTQEVQAIPTAEHIVEEAPKAVVDRDPVFPGRPERVFVGARAQGAEIGINIYRRNHPTDTSGETYAVDGAVAGMFLMAALNTTLNSEDAQPTATVQIQADYESITRITAAIDAATPEEIGQDLANVIRIGDEYLAFSGYTNATATTLDLTNVYRGLMDSVPADHTIGDDVYLLCVNSGLSEAELPVGDLVDIQPRATSRDDEMTSGEAKTFSFTMDNRYRRPYPPSRMDLNSVRMDPTVDIENDLDVDWYRRNYTLTDEVAALDVDDTGVDASHESQVRILGDDGIVELVTSAWQTGNGTQTFARADILKKTNGVLPTAAQVRIRSRHDVDALTDLESLYELSQTTAMSDAELSGLANLGTLGANTPSGAYVIADGAVDHNFRLEGGTLAGDIEYQLNSITGSWTTLIASGNTTGVIAAAALTTSDDLFIRHADTTDSDNNVMLFGAEDGAPDTDVVYAVLTDDAEWNNLRGYWSMDESSAGSSQTDRVARFGSGTPDFTDVNTCESQAGQTNFANAVRLQQITGPTQEHLVILNADAADRLIPTGDVTVTAWVRFASGSLDGTTRTLIGLFDIAQAGPTFTDCVFSISARGSDDRLIAQMFDNTAASGGTASSSAAMSEETWHHIALVKSGTTYTVYLDGTAGGFTGTLGSSTLNTTTTDLFLGTSENSGAVDTSNAQLDTAMDEVRIYHRALSGAEISELAGRTSPV